MIFKVFVFFSEILDVWNNLKNVPPASALISCKLSILSTFIVKNNVEKILKHIFSIVRCLFGPNSFFESMFFAMLMVDMD